MVFASRPSESCHHRCLSAVCGVLGYPKGSAAELLDGALKLRCCVTPFSNRFPTWSLPPIGNGRIRSLDVATNHLDGEGGNMAKRVRLTKKTQGSVTPVSIPDQGHSTPRRWKRLRLPSSEGVGWGRCGRTSAPFSTPWSWVRCLHLGTPGTCFRRERRRAFAGWSVQPKGLVRWHQPV